VAEEAKAAPKAAAASPSHKLNGDSPMHAARNRSGGLPRPEKPGPALQLSAQRRRDEYREVDPIPSSARATDPRGAQSNDEGVLVHLMKGTSEPGKCCSPAPDAEVLHRVASGRQTLIPPPRPSPSDEQAGEERLFIVLSRIPSPAGKLIYSLGAPGPARRTPPEAREQPKHLLSAPWGRWTTRWSAAWQPGIRADLVFEKVGRSTPGDKKVKAVYVVNPTPARSPWWRM